MKDKEARKDIRRVESKSDKVCMAIARDIKRVESKGDKARADLLGRVEELEKLTKINGIDGSGYGLKEQVRGLWRRFLEMEKGWDSKFVKVEAHWEERKEKEEK